MPRGSSSRCPGTRCWPVLRGRFSPGCADPGRCGRGPGPADRAARRRPARGGGAGSRHPGRTATAANAEFATGDVRARRAPASRPPLRGDCRRGSSARLSRGRPLAELHRLLPPWRSRHRDRAGWARMTDLVRWWRSTRVRNPPPWPRCTARCWPTAGAWSCGAGRTPPNGLVSHYLGLLAGGLGPDPAEAVAPT